MPFWLLKLFQKLFEIHRQLNAEGQNVLLVQCAVWTKPMRFFQLMSLSVFLAEGVI